MHKTLHLVRELLPDTIPSTQGEVFSASLLDEMLAPYKTLDSGLAFCLGAQLWNNIIRDSSILANFTPTLKYEGVLEGFAGSYKGVPIYTDAFSIPEQRFLRPMHLVLAMLTRDGNCVESLIRLDAVENPKAVPPAAPNLHEDRNALTQRLMKFSETSPDEWELRLKQ